MKPDAAYFREAEEFWRGLEASESEPHPAAEPEPAIEHSQDILPQDPDWPSPIGAMAKIGLAGEFVQMVSPHTEASEESLLVQFLVAYGNVIGRCAHFVVEADAHYANLFVCLVGDTSKARKGSSWGHVRNVFRAVDEHWALDRVISGIASGEALIAAVRDDAEGRDKRLMLLEPEFAALLARCERDGSILSQQLRLAWDTGHLRNETKHNPMRATDAHVSLVAHVTRPELLATLTTISAANGLANRFLWVATKRARMLPHGGRIYEVDFAPFLRRLAQAIDFGRRKGRTAPDDHARAVWERVYPRLSQAEPGLFGSITARAEAITMRLAMIYSLLDCSAEIRAEHIFAALEVWRYAYDSARWIWGDSVGDQIADRILRYLREQGAQGASRTQISAALGRNVPSARMAAALNLLTKFGRARVEYRETRRGRPEEIWYATNASRSSSFSS